MSSVRVRFAPSPTGYLHVGGARTALFNWLFARKHKGKFILRIEDTDLERSTVESEEGLLNDMRWMGLDWDEGPGIGGPHGPYRQSERTALYKKAAETLLHNGSAYRCFCTEEKLEEKRKLAEGEHRAPHYDGTCLRLSKEEVEKRLAANTPYVVRVKAPHKDYHVDDLVRGRVEWKAETLGDFIILRSNGMPVYNFCVVVDDSDMEISHVIRAEEHLTNTHRQLILYEALGRKTPIFAHVSLILGPDKSKLSKRHGATAVGQFGIDGFLKSAMINFLALLGWNEGTNEEIYTLEALIEKFSLERINPAPAVFDHVKLTWMNGQHIRGLPDAQYLGFVKPLLQQGFANDPRVADPVVCDNLCLLVKPALALLTDITKVVQPILHGGAPENDEAAQVLQAPEVPALMTALREEYATCDWAREPLNTAMKAAGKKAGAKGKGLFMPIRVQLTGNCHGPDLLGIMEVLGRAETLRRLGQHATAASA
jgi:glutamyl-tRNA synthetase